jgi:lipopolysaccharide export system protein LptA
MAALNAHAEKADAGKEAVFEFESLNVDDVNQINTMTGKVTIIKGTLVLRADKAVVRQTPQENTEVLLTASGLGSVNFRQKRDGGPDLWIEGEAQRIEYDERTDVVKLFTAARIRQYNGTRMTEEIESEFISYDSIREMFTARNDASGVSRSGGGRGKMIIAPRAPQLAPATQQAPAAVRQI